MVIYFVSHPFFHPEAKEVAVFVGGFDWSGDGEVGFGLVCGGEVFDLVAGLGFQEDEFDVMGIQHGMEDGTDLDGDVATGLNGLENMLFVGAIGGIVSQFRLVLDRFLRDDDLVVDLVEMHAGPLFLFGFATRSSRTSRMFFVICFSVRHTGMR